MLLYNISIDQTEEVSLAFYLKHRFFKFFKVDAPIALTYSIVVPAKAICKKCIEGIACKLFDNQREKYRKAREAERAIVYKYFISRDIKYNKDANNELFLSYCCSKCKQDINICETYEHALQHEKEACL